MSRKTLTNAQAAATEAGIDALATSDQEIESLIHTVQLRLSETRRNAIWSIRDAMQMLGGQEMDKSANVMKARIEEPSTRLTKS